MLSGRRVDCLTSLQSELAGESRIIPLDITNSDEIRSAYKQIGNNFASVDSVICMSADYDPMTVDNLDLQKCKNIIDTNLVAAFSLLHAVVPDFKSRGFGQIVFCGSVAGYRGLQNGQPYSASKAALINLAESARIELNPFGIDIKIINPGFVKTEMTDKNTFAMPMIISPEIAAQKIADQLSDPNKFEIRTHGLFSFLMEVIRILPYCLYFRLMRKSV